MAENNIELVLARLEKNLNSLAPIAIAVSGGVDSMTLAHIAKRILPETFMFHALSPAVPDSATARVKEYAELWGWQLSLINAREMEDPAYLSNPVNRCYFCKSNLYQTIRAKTSLNIISGTNIDDLNDFRPGLIAAKENNVYHPYVDSNINKNLVRKLAMSFGLSDLQELPASPCLSSRITTNIRINPQLLGLIDKTEIAVRDLLLDELQVQAVRCRILKDSVVIQIGIESKVGVTKIIETNTENRMSFIEEFQSRISKPYTKIIHKVVKNIFLDQGFDNIVSSIKIEPYKKGSAFKK